MKHLEFPGQPDSKLNATVFLHGFPGVRSIQNRDIAERASRETGRHCYVPLYEGLGFSEGEFSFRNCRASVESFVAELISKHGKIDLVGHSWGGYLSLGLAAKHGPLIEKLVLMSPLLDFFTIDICDQSFTETAKLNPQLKLGKIEDRAREFTEVGGEVTAKSLAEKVDTATRVFILQAATDDITPEKFSRELIGSFKVTPKYELVSTDHSFLIDREAAAAKVIAALKA